MKPSLQLKIGQHLTMTPQLQQAIRLLQLSSLDLQSEIQEALETNPMLDSQEDTPSDENLAGNTLNQEEKATANTEDVATIDSSEALKNEVIDKELAVDTQWEDWQYTPPTSMSRPDEDREFEFQGATTDSLQDHLYWQLDLTLLSERDKAVATVIIDAIDEEGYLRVSNDELIELFNSDLDPDSIEEERIEEDEVIAVLKMIPIV